MVAADRDAGRVNLRVAGMLRYGCALFVARTPDGGDVAALGVGREIENVAVTARGQNDGVSSVGGQFSGHKVVAMMLAGMAVDGDEVEHFPCAGTF